MDNLDDDKQEFESESTPQSEGSQGENLPQKSEAHMALNTKDKQATLSGSKKAIELLQKKKMIITAAVVGGVAVIFITVLLAFLTTTESTDYLYKESTCTNVTVHYDPYGEESDSSTTMELEQYIRSAVYAYTKDMKNVPSSMYHVYFSLAVALRNEVITNNCEITYRDKKLSTSIPENMDRDYALENAKGITIVDSNNEFIPVKVSDFCWKEYKEPDYILFNLEDLKVNNTFTDTYLSNEIYRDCACNKYTEIEIVEETDEDKCWTYWPNEVDEDKNEVINYKREYLHQDDENGYNLYGAYYLLVSYGRLYGEQLRYFFGQDFYYRTINKENTKENQDVPQTNCSTFSLTDTTLTKDEFITSVESYHYNGEKPDSWKMFVNNAGNIYDMAISNNVNPEMIFVRATLEGFSPGGSTFNYFGITCYNGEPEQCTKYSSFDSGIMGFIEVVKGYDSYEDFTGRYAYLGDYWYNPGSWSDGGCKYASYIYPDGLDSYVQDACSDARKGRCVAKGDTSMCVVTRDEDRKAYSVYQGRNMTNRRFEIFGIEEDNCTNDTMNSGNCVIYNQSDPRWGSNYLGFSTYTISNSGCALTSIAIAMTCTGEITDDFFSPSVLNEAFKEKGGFSGADVIWDNLAIKSYIPSFRVGERFSFNIKETTEKKINILKTVNEGPNRIGIVHIKNSNHIRGHFVVLKTINTEDNTIITLDPAGGKISTYSISDVDGFKYYTY